MNSRTPTPPEMRTAVSRPIYCTRYERGPDDIRHAMPICTWSVIGILDNGNMYSPEYDPTDIDSVFDAAADIVEKWCGAVKVERTERSERGACIGVVDVTAEFYGARNLPLQRWTEDSQSDDAFEEWRASA